MQSETIGALAAALAKAQGEIAPAPMDRDNTFFHAKYATLTSLWEAARAALAKNGLAVTQVTDFDNSGGLILITTLLHSSGEWIGGVYPIRGKDNTPQATGSALTYARRYAFGALVGLTSDDDDDGNTAQHGTNGGAQQQTKPAAAAPNGTTTGKATANGSAAKGTAPVANNGQADTQSPAFKACMAKGVEVFGLEWKDARPWLVERFTAKETPANIRTSSKDLTDAELKTITGWLEEYGKGLRKSWTEHREAKRAELDSITVNGAQEMAH